MSIKLNNKFEAIKTDHGWILRMKYIDLSKPKDGSSKNQ